MLNLVKIFKINQLYECQRLGFTCHIYIYIYIKIRFEIKFELLWIKKREKRRVFYKNNPTLPLLSFFAQEFEQKENPDIFDYDDYYCRERQ